MLVELYVFIGLFLFILHLSRGSRGNARLPPGPKGIPIFGYLPFMGKVPCLTVQKLAKKYGKLMTIQMGTYPVVFVNDFQTAKELFKMDVLTGRAQLELFERRGYYGIGLLEGKDWNEFHRFMMRCLKDLGFGKKSMESSIMEEVVECRQLLRNYNGKPVYLKPLIEIAIINALWVLLTGEKYDIQDPLKKKILHIMSDGLAAQNIVGVAALVPWLARIFPNVTGYAKGLEYFGAPEQLANEILMKHINTYSSSTERDFIDAGLNKIYNTTNPCSQFYGERGMKNLHYTLIDLFFAGSDTISSTLGWTFLYLAISPKIQSYLYEEINRVIGNRLPSLEDRPKLPYVEATMAEVMRKSSMVPFGLFHSAISDFDYEGYRIPKGTYFLGNIHSIHQDQSYWGDPEIFRPERFLKNGQFNRDEHLIPFFIGKRTCPAENLAMMEYFLFLVGILQKYEFQLNPNEVIPNVGPRSGFVLTPPKHNLILIDRNSV